MADRDYSGGSLWKKSGIYQIRCTVNGNLYIGSASNISRRWSLHQHQLDRGKHHSQHLQSAWEKYGGESFAFEVLEMVPVEDLIRVEQEYIDRLIAPDRSRSYNMSLVAGSCRGVVRTAEYRAKMSAANKGRKCSAEARANMSASHLGLKASDETKAKRSATMKGRVFTPEWREKISQANKGRKSTPETCANISRGLTGRVRTEESRRKMSEKMMGHSVSPETGKKISQANAKVPKDQYVDIKQLLELGFTKQEVANAYNISMSSVDRMARLA